MLALCRANGGFYIKAAQYASTLSVPQPYVDALGSLQDRAVQSPAAAVRRVVREAVGGEEASAELLAGVDLEQPVGCASLAQVYRGRLRDGREVAIKVQHGGVADELALDAATLGLVVHGVHATFGWDFRWAVPDFEQRVRAELNFCQEARNAERARSNLAASRLPVHVPRIHWDKTSPRVLVMEWCEGMRATDPALWRERKAPQAREAARLLAEVFAEMVCVHGFVHADLHPGNILFRFPGQADERGGVTATPSGGVELVLLDHGAYRELSDEIRVAYCSLLRALAVGDELGCQDEARKLLGDGAPVAARFLPLLLAGPKSGSTESPQLAALRREARLMKLDQLARLLDSLPVALLATLRAGRMAHGVSDRLGLDRGERLIVQARAALRGRRNAQAAASSDGGLGVGRLRTALDIAALNAFVGVQRALALFGVGRLADMRRKSAVERRRLIAQDAAEAERRRLAAAAVAASAPRQL